MVLQERAQKAPDGSDSDDDEQQITSGYLGPPRIIFVVLGAGLVGAGIYFKNS